jgi:uncharacterized protein (DUF2252 family)
LAVTPASGLRVQACGDCHLLNFGAFATPERRVIFAINDLDETLPAPWEWDVKRLAASFVLACRDNGFGEDTARDAVLSCVRSYREHMAEYSTMRALDVWYSSIEVEKMISTMKDEQTSKRLQKRLAKARERSVLEHEFAAAQDWRIPGGTFVTPLPPGRFRLRMRLEKGSPTSHESARNCKTSRCT